MRDRLGRLRAEARREAGFTLIELLVATAMGVIVMGAVVVLVVGTMKSQPEISKRAQTISTARWVLDRLTREIRNGQVVNAASSSSVSFRTYVRRTSCGSTTPLASNLPAILCQVTYTCTTTSCSRTETAPGVMTGGTPATIFTGIDESSVFCYVPSSNADPTTCGPPPKELSTITYIGVKLHFPNPTGPAGLTISDGASLSNATLKD